MTYSGLVHRSSPQDLKTIKLQRKLYTALRYAKGVCVIGAHNKREDLEKTNGWSTHQRFFRFQGQYFNQSKAPYSEDRHFRFNAQYCAKENKLIYNPKTWYYALDGYQELTVVKSSSLDPVNDPAFNLPNETNMIIHKILSATTHREGSCSALACLVTNYLWKNAEGINKIEIISMPFDHCFVVINREGDIADCTTWGNSWIIDAWYKEGIIFHASELEKKIVAIKDYTKEQTEKLIELGLTYNGRLDDFEQEIKYSLVYKIEPKINIYPSYSPFLSIENYYQLNQSSLADEMNHKKNHQAKLANSLAQITSPEKEKTTKWTRFYKKSTKRNYLIEGVAAYYSAIFKEIEEIASKNKEGLPVEDRRNNSVIRFYNNFNRICQNIKNQNQLEAAEKQLILFNSEVLDSINRTRKEYTKSSFAEVTSDSRSEDNASSVSLKN